MPRQRSSPWAARPPPRPDDGVLAPQDETSMQEPRPDPATATITCPECATRARAAMPENACQYFYVCTGCGVRLTPRAGDCCVFCSYSDSVCPPRQAG
ncbi:MAG: GDCCVxC domain-containing (seleno)protein [Solirubrobacteraceae bacterium]